MPPNLDQGLLEVSLRSSGFPQTGSWNMSQTAERLVQIPVSMLQRYQASRVQPYTMLLAEAMGMTFHMRLQGRKNLSDALSKLPAHQILGRSLEIGFGIEDITKLLAKSEGGSTIVALCAALQDCYLDDLAIEILLEYVKATKATDDRWMPSNNERMTGVNMPVDAGFTAH